MAQLDLASVNSLKREKFIPLLVDNIFDSNIMARKYLANAEKLSGGRKIITPLEVAKATNYIGFYTDYDTQTPNSNAPIKQADWEWVQAYAGINLSGREVGLNSGDAQVLSLLTSKLKNAEKSLKDLFGLAIWNGGAVGSSGTYKEHTSLAYIDNSSTASDGDGHIITSNVGATTGGITSTASGTDDYWFVPAGNKLTPTLATAGSPVVGDLTALTDGVAHLVSLMTQCYGACTIDNDQPDLIVTTQTMYDAYESCLQANKRYMGEVTTGNAGFRGLQFKNALVVVDSHVADGEMYFLNSNYLDYKVHSSRNFEWEGFKQQESVDATYGRIFWMGQFVCTNPRMIGCITGGPA